MRSVRTLKVGAAIAAGLLLAGCTAMPEQPGFGQVQAEAEQRGGYRVHWYTGADEDERAQEAVQDLLKQGLTAEQAVQVALLNNRRLQAMYQELGVAQADLVQAGLLNNPVFDAEVMFPSGGGSAELELGVAQSFLEIFFIPLRKRVAESQFEQAKLRVTGEVLDLAYDTQTAFYRVQRDAQRVELFEQVVEATDLSYTFARRLREAGNITELDLHQQRDLYEEARLQLRRAEADLANSRERVNRLLGLWGEQTQWAVADRLPDVPDQEQIDLSDLEARVIDRSLDLAIARQRILIGGQRLGVTEATALLPELHLGGKAERGDGWSAGPVLELPIPLFDRGQARLARSRAELRQQQERFAALAVEIRSIARAARHQLQAAEDVARHYRQVVLPLRERITNETQLQYNAMQLGPIELLRARERQIDAGERYVQALYDYWTARATVEQLLRGRMPTGEVLNDRSSETQTDEPAGGGGH